MGHSMDKPKRVQEKKKLSIKEKRKKKEERQNAALQGNPFSKPK